jgi:hypothetical protein
VARDITPFAKIFPITYQDKGRDAGKDETGFTMGWGYAEMSLNGSSFKHKHRLKLKHQ